VRDAVPPEEPPTAPSDGLPAEDASGVPATPEPGTPATPGPVAAGPARRGRRPSPDTARAILDASREILAERGVQGLTVEAVAQRSGVAKTTIYRRWRAKDEVALAVVIDMIERVVDTPELGNTRDELVAFVDLTVRALRDTLMGRVMQGIVSQLATDAELAAGFHENVVGLRFMEVKRLVERGIERGDLRADTDPVLVHELLFGAVYYHLFFRHDPIPDDLAERAVDTVLRGIAAA
jgi:AcrR family transcriptional regulator